MSDGYQLLVRTTDDPDDIFEVECESDANIGYMIAMISSIKNHPPEDISISVDGKILPPDTLISSLDLGKIVAFTANLERHSDHFLDQMFDARQQAAIEQQIRQRNIEANLEYAYQNNPEAFVPYSLLWINCMINNKPVLAMLDTGAQMSILPLTIAQQCQVDYLVDQRWASLAVGVGVQKTYGRIHSLPVNIQGRVWANPFTVMTEGPLDHCILGVDWLTKNRATINLEQRCLVIDDIVVPFIEKP